MWCLFAKIEDIVTLSSEEVAVVRDVGKAAIEVIRRRVMSEEDDDVVEDEDDEDEDDEVEDKVDLEQDNSYAEEHVEDLVHDDNVSSRPELTRRNTSSDEEGEDDHLALQAAQARLLKTIHTPTSATAEQNSAPSDQPSPPPAKAASRLKSAAASRLEGTAASEMKGTTAAAVSNSKQITPPTPETKEDLAEAEVQMDAVLDMVLTIVGEEFGQRDLLVARDYLWSGIGGKGS